MWVTCFHAKKKVGDVEGGGQREEKEVSCILLFPCPPFSAAYCCLLLDKCLLVPAASFCPFLQANDPGCLKLWIPDTALLNLANVQNRR
jgi:hypothetical protein